MTSKSAREFVNIVNEMLSDCPNKIEIKNMSINMLETVTSIAEGRMRLIDILEGNQDLY